MSRNSDPDEDHGLLEFLERLIGADELSGAAANGIAKRAIDKGWDALSEEQVATLKKYGLAKWRERSFCSVDHCQEPMPWDEVDLDEGDEQVCSRCRHKMEKD